MSEYRNAEYYPDPTAYKALKNIEETEIKRGDVYMMYKNPDKSGEKFPVVIVSNDKINSKSGFIVYVCANENVDSTYDTNIPVSRGNVRGCAVCSKVCTTGKDKLAELVGTLGSSEMREIEKAILVSLGITVPETVTPPPVTKATPPPKPTVIFKDDPEKDAKIIRLEAEKAIFEKLYRELLQSTLAK
jgi:mRNA-degrading endonuclease toxin of MazEF toxin-antitoxin module